MDNHEKPFRMPQPIGLFAGELYDLGVDYLKAFKKLDNSLSFDFLLPGSFLANHALELLLKSFLAAKGERKKTIIEKFGHRLPIIFDQCLSLGLPTIDLLDQLVESMHEMNRNQDFRYPTGYELTITPPSVCLFVLSPLAEQVGPFVLRARVKAELQFAYETRHLQGRLVEWSD